MIYILSVLILLVFSSTNVQTKCVPEPVPRVYLEGTILTWDASTNCEGTYYLLVIQFPDTNEVEFEDEVDGTKINVDFLDFCTPYIFSVLAIAGSEPATYTDTIDTLQLPNDTNITISNAAVAHANKDIIFHWEVSLQYVNCVDQYKLLLYPEHETNPMQITTNEKQYVLKDAPGCMTYRLKVALMHQSIQQLIYTFNYTVPPVINTPSLVNISQGTTSINMTWALESYTVNKCFVSALHVQGERFRVSIPVEDGPKRPDVDVNLSGLKANSMYYLSVTVENLAGISKPFQLAVQTLPLE